jgi:hypothetical protein
MSAHPPTPDVLLRRLERVETGQLRLMHCSKLLLYSITSSARASSFAGTSSPSDLAVLRLMKKIEFRWLQYRQVGRFFALEDAGGYHCLGGERRGGPQRSDHVRLTTNQIGRQ